MSRKCVALGMMAAALPICVVVRAGETAGAETVEEALGRKFDKLTVSSTLLEAFRKYEKLGGVKIVVDWGILRGTGVRPNTRIALQLKSVTFEQVLDKTLILVAPKQHPLAWYTEDKAIHVTTQLRMLYRRRLPLPPVAGLKPGRAAGASEAPRRRSGGVREMAFENLPLEDVLDFFREVSGVNFHVNWKSLELIGVDRETAISLKARGISIARALDLVMDQVSAGQGRLDRVYWIIDRGVVMIGTGSSFNTKTRVRMWDISDLLAVVPNYRAPRMSFDNNQSGNNRSSSDRNDSGGGTSIFEDRDRGTGSGSSDRDEVDIPAEQERLREALIKIIRESIGEDMWQPDGEGSVRIYNNKLIISQTLLGFKLLERSGVIR